MDLKVFPFETGSF